jgi:hypothetical protein
MFNDNSINLKNITNKAVFKNIIYFLYTIKRIIGVEN